MYVDDTCTRIEIINNTRGDIEGRIWERGDWGTNSSPDSLTMPQAKSLFRRVFLLFEMFFLVKILKLSFQIV